MASTVGMRTGLTNVNVAHLLHGNVAVLVAELVVDSFAMVGLKQWANKGEVAVGGDAFICVQRIDCMRPTGSLCHRRTIADASYSKPPVKRSSLIIDWCYSPRIASQVSLREIRS